MKIAHISDLHLDIHHKRNSISDTVKVLEFISDNKFDHVIITGDITDLSESSSFLMARNIFKKFGLLNSEKLTLTIGNHDIFGGVHFAEDVIEFPARCKNTNYIGKIKEFAECFHECFDKTQTVNNNTFPFIKEFDEFIIAGLNSIAGYSVLKNPFASNGRISSAQLSYLIELILGIGKISKRKIALTHHHFGKTDSNETGKTGTPGTIWQSIERQTMKLKRKKKILRVFSKIGIELVLHGHLHEISEYSRNRIKFINTGGSILANDIRHYSVCSLEISSSGITNQFLKIPRLPVPLPDAYEIGPLKYNPLRSYSGNICMN